MKSKMDLKRVLATNPLLLRSCEVRQAAYLVLEEGLDEEAAVLDVRAEAL